MWFSTLEYEPKRELKKTLNVLTWFKKKINIVSPAEKSEAFSADQDTSLVFVVSADKHRDLAGDGEYHDHTVTRLKIVTAIFSQRKDIEGTNILTKQIKISKWNFCD